MKTAQHSIEQCLTSLHGCASIEEGDPKIGEVNQYRSSVTPLFEKHNAVQDRFQTTSGEGNGYCCGEKALVTLFVQLDFG